MYSHSLIYVSFILILLNCFGVYSQSEYWKYFINDTISAYSDHSWSNDCNDPKGKESPVDLNPIVDFQDDHHIKTRVSFLYNIKDIVPHL